MIQRIDIKGKVYPFRFGLREIHHFQQSARFDGDPNDFVAAMTRVSVDFDAFLELFVLANKKGARLLKDAEPDAANTIEKTALEDALDDEPDLFRQLQDAFNVSMMSRDEAQGEDDSKKKKKS